MLPINKSIAAKVIITIFCLWHITAVGVTSYSDTIKGPGPDWVTGNIRKPFRNYTRYNFNQKQSWRAFSSPGRLVTHFYIDVRDDQGNYIEQAAINPWVLDWRMQSHNLKAVLNLAQKKKSRTKIRKSYARTYCERLNLEPGTVVMLRKRFYLIPKKEIGGASSWWKGWEPEWDESPVLKTRCPDPNNES